MDLDSFHDELVRIRLDCGIELKVTREGLFAFDFTDWAIVLPSVEQTGTENFEQTVDAVLQRTLVNSFLVLLYSDMLREGRGSIDRMVVTPELAIPMESLEKQDGHGLWEFQGKPSGAVGVSQHLPAEIAIHHG